MPSLLLPQHSSGSQPPGLRAPVTLNACPSPAPRAPAPSSRPPGALDNLTFLLSLKCKCRRGWGGHIWFPRASSSPWTEWMLMNICTVSPQPCRCPHALLALPRALWGRPAPSPLAFLPPSPPWFPDLRLDSVESERAPHAPQQGRSPLPARPCSPDAPSPSVLCCFSGGRAREGRPTERENAASSQREKRLLPNPTSQKGKRAPALPVPRAPSPQPRVPSPEPSLGKVLCWPGSSACGGRASCVPGAANSCLLPGFVCLQAKNAFYIFKWLKIIKEGYFVTRESYVSFRFQDPKVNFIGAQPHPSLL